MTDRELLEPELVCSDCEEYPCVCEPEGRESFEDIPDDIDDLPNQECPGDIDDGPDIDDYEEPTEKKEPEDKEIDHDY